jgi:hypothetical protein
MWAFVLVWVGTTLSEAHPPDEDRLILDCSPSRILGSVVYNRSLSFDGEGSVFAVTAYGGRRCLDCQNVPPIDLRDVDPEHRQHYRSEARRAPYRRYLRSIERHPPPPNWILQEEPQLRARRRDPEHGAHRTRRVSILERAEGPHWATLLLSIDEPPLEPTEWWLQRKTVLGWRRIPAVHHPNLRPEPPVLGTAGAVPTSRWDPVVGPGHHCTTQEVYTPGSLPGDEPGKPQYVTQLGVGPPPAGASHVVVRFGPEHAPQTRIVKVDGPRWSFGARGVPWCSWGRAGPRYVGLEPIANDEPLELEYIDPWGRRLPPVVVDPAAAEPCPRTNRVID